MDAVSKRSLMSALERLFAANPVTYQSDWHVAVQAFQAAKQDATPTLDEARTLLWRGADKSSQCHLCGQHVQVYHRELDSGLAYALMFFYTKTSTLGDADRWIYMPTHAPRVVLRAKNFGLLKHWGLIERRSKDNSRNPKGPLKGFWRITERGWSFALGQTTVDKVAVIYDDKLLAHEGGPWTIKDALSLEFDWGKLVHNSWDWKA